MIQCVVELTENNEYLPESIPAHSKQPPHLNKSLWKVFAWFFLLGFCCLDS